MGQYAEWREGDIMKAPMTIHAGGSANWLNICPESLEPSWAAGVEDDSCMY